jgi:hypothetical protein
MPSEYILQEAFMFPLSAQELIMTMAASLFLMGTICIVSGVFILITRAFSKDMKLIAQQTSSLAQKGIVEDVTGLVGNASSLLNTLNDLVRTTMGIGIFLILSGFLLVSAAYYLAIRIG